MSPRCCRCGRFEPQGAVLVATSPDTLDKILKSDTQRYSTLFKGAGN